MCLIYQASKSIGRGKSQLFRRKSELPHDLVTLNALDKHKRNDLLSSNVTTKPPTSDPTITTTTTTTTSTAIQNTLS
jgi:hypothetical protein